MKEKAKRDVEAALAEQRRLRKLQLERTKEPVEIDYDPANVVAETHVGFSTSFSFSYIEINCESFVENYSRLP